MGGKLPRKIFIVGWYGTETVGDKAVLGGLIHDCREENPAVNFSISSMYPFITRQTLIELEETATVIPPFGPAFIRACMTSDRVMVGGGPLMHLEALSIPLWAFIIAKLFGKERVIWGCGLGPLAHERYVRAVTALLRLATTVKLRDSASVAWASRSVHRKPVDLVPDPATDYVLSRKRALGNQIAKDNQELACFLRDWPREYASDLSDDEYHLKKQQFEATLASEIRRLCGQYNLHVTLYPMHVFAVGQDDRVFSRRFASSFLGMPERAVVSSRPSTVDSTVYAMLKAGFSICMRYHSVLFAHVLGCRYAAIDYTRGGKIASYLRDQGALASMATLTDFANGTLEEWNRRIAQCFG